MFYSPFLILCLAASRAGVTVFLITDAGLLLPVTGGGGGGGGGTALLLEPYKQYCYINQGAVCS